MVCLFYVLFCFNFVNVCVVCVNVLFVLCFVLSLFRSHASPQTTGEGKRGMGPARAGPMVWDTQRYRAFVRSETGNPRGDGRNGPTRGRGAHEGGEGHEVRGNVGCSDKVPRGEGVCPTRGRSVGL